jgi:LuxR family maltose regulon positive regulatory protein
MGDEDPHARLDAGVLGFRPGCCRAPMLREWVIPRDDLVKALLANGHAEIVAVSAPPGYGKTTTVRLWDRADRRPFAWAHLEPSDNNAVHLAQHLALSLQEVGPLAADLVRLLEGPGHPLDSELLPVLGRELARLGPLVLVLEDVHVLRTPETIRGIESLQAWVPEGSQLVLVGRTVPLLHLKRHRLTSDVAELTVAELALSEAEGSELLRASDFIVDDDTAAELARRTEGWPAGMHLAALALSRSHASGAPEPLSGRHRLIADYLVEEVLSRLPQELTTFLEESAVLSRMSAALLDDLLESDRSSQLLIEADGVGSAFVVPLDDERMWYRYHHLLGELLHQRLKQRDPVRAQHLEERASALLEAAGDIDSAIRHAVRADRFERAADLVLRQVLPLAATGQLDRLHPWLDLLGPEAIDRYPGAVVGRAWWGLATGDADAVRRAMIAADQLGDAGRLADGTPSLSVAMAAVRAMVASHGLDALLRDTEIVRDAGGPATNPWWGLATLVQGTARSMLGELDRARELLCDAQEALAGQPGFEAATLGHLALLALYDDDPVIADRLASRAMQITRTNRLDRVVPAVSESAIVAAIAAAVAARNRHVEEAERAGRTADLLLARLGDLSPRTALLGYLLLARTGRSLGRLAQARVWLEEAERARRRDRSATYLNTQLAELRGQLAEGIDLRDVLVQPLTAAELRVLAYLPTHLSLQEIAEHLIISRNTAKTHSVAIYRKLGVSSRSDAVAAARRFGLLEAAHPELV